MLLGRRLRWPNAAPSSTPSPASFPSMTSTSSSSTGRTSQVEDPRLREIVHAHGRALGDRASLVGAGAGAGRAAAQSGRRLLPSGDAADLDPDAALRRRRRPSLPCARSSGCASRSRSTASPISSWRAAPASSRPGIDQIIARRLGLDNVERTLVGFMGCYAAVCALAHRPSYRPLAAGRARARGHARAVHPAPPGHPGSSSNCSPCSSSATAPARP